MAQVVQAIEEVINALITVNLNPTQLSHKLQNLYDSVMILISNDYQEELQYLSVYQDLFNGIRHFLIHKEQHLRKGGLRVLRYILKGYESFQLIITNKIQILLMRCFEQEEINDERVEAFKIIKKWILNSPQNFPHCLVLSLASCAESDNDEFKEMSMEGLRLLSTKNIRLVAWSGGIRVLIQALLDNKTHSSLHQNILYTISYLLNDEKTRVYLKNGKEVNKIFSVFTDQDSGLSEQDLEVQIKLARKSIVQLSRQWSGLIYMASNGLSTVIESLKQPFKPQLKEGILDTIGEMLNIQSHTPTRNHNIFNNYLSMLLSSLLHCDLFQALTHIALDKNVRISIKARKLLKTVTRFASDLLPDAPQFPLMLDTASSFKAAELVADIDSSARLQKDGQNDRNFLSAACEFVSFENMRGAASANWVLSGIYKQHAINAVDDNLFVNMLNKSGVSKDTLRWDWDTIYEIMSGPITIQHRFQMALKRQFLKNLLSYFMPSKRLFHDLPWNPGNFTKARVGSFLISILLSQEDGANLLTATYSESFFVSRKSYMIELCDAIDEEINVLETGRQRIGRLFSPESMKGYMAREYFKWIGHFTGTQGRKLLKQYGLSNKLLKLAKVEHLSPVLLPHLNYNDQTSKDFITFAIQTENFIVKKHAMEHIRLLFRAGVYDLTWVICELATQIYSNDTDTVNCALSVLIELCQEKQYLHVLIITGPQRLQKVGELGNRCLIRFLSSSDGVNYLENFDFIQSELDRWRQEGNEQFVQELESKIQRGLTEQQKRQAIKLFTPLAYQHTPSLEIAWIRKLPFSITLHISTHGRELTLVLDIFIEIEQDQILMVTKLADNYIIEPSETISTCLLLADFYIDDKGNDATKPNWITCTVEDRLRERQKNPDQQIVEIEKDGVIFKLMYLKDQKFKLLSVMYRLGIHPRPANNQLFPTHLYGELVKTKLGIKHLIDSKHLEELMQELLDDQQTIITKRSCLWALGSAGCTERGAAYLQQLGGIRLMVDIAENCEVLSLRGTAFQALSLVSQSQTGCNQLSRLGWITPQQGPANLVIPSNLNKFLSVKPQEEESRDFYYDQIDEIIQQCNLNQEERLLLDNLIGIGNVGNRSEFERYLKSKRQMGQGYQGSGKVFYLIMLILSAYSFKLPTRRFIHRFYEKIGRNLDLFKELDELPNFTN